MAQRHAAGTGLAEQTHRNLAEGQQNGFVPTEERLNQQQEIESDRCLRCDTRTHPMDFAPTARLKV
ncbi:hypothetical protein J2W80_001112 [Methylorubrum extorquens]|nr:hypothetical protein [Methylorubrum extorquens]